MTVKTIKSITDPLTIRLVIIDDHQVVIDGLRAMLEGHAHIEVIGTAHNGKDGIQAIKILEPDLVLMDINMPELDGIETTALLSRQYPEIKVLMLSMLKEQSMVRKAMDKGALGYVLKNEGRDELIHAIKTVAAGNRYLSDDLQTKNLMIRESTGPKISRREKQVLQLIVDEFTAKEIADKLFISINTVDSHRKNLLMKLNARNTAGLVRIALENNLVE